MDNESPKILEAQMAETRQSITEKVAALEESVVAKVHSATAAVTDTVQTVKNAVGETVDAVKENVAQTLDVSRHVRENPWTAVGTAALAGVLAGVVLFRRNSQTVNQAALIAPTVSEPRATPRSLVSAPAESRTPGVCDALIGRMNDELKKLGEIVIDRFSTEIHRAIDTTVPKIVDHLTIVPSEKHDSEYTANHSWNGTHDPIRRAM